MGLVFKKTMRMFTTISQGYYPSDVKATSQEAEMKSKMKTRLAAGLTAGAMMLTVASPAMAQVNAPVQVNSGNLIAALNNVNVDIDNVVVRDVVDVNNNRVNVNALQNFLNRNDIDVNIEDVLNDNNVEVLNNVVTIQGVEVIGDTLVILV